MAIKLRKVVNIEFVNLETPEKIYNLNVDDFHTYFVGEDGLLVHNSCQALEMAAGREYVAGMRRNGETDSSKIANEATMFVKRIKLSMENLKKAINLYNKYPDNNTKTVAVSGSTNTISGWSDNAITGVNDFNRTITYLDVFDKADEISYTIQFDSVRDQGIAGRFNAVHAEKQMALLINISEDIIAVSRDMCNDCIYFFAKWAFEKKVRIIIADPKKIRVFKPDGNIFEYKFSDFKLNFK